MASNNNWERRERDKDIRHVMPFDANHHEEIYPKIFSLNKSTKSIEIENSLKGERKRMRQAN
jgi:hypothetical protein